MKRNDEHQPKQAYSHPMWSQKRAQPGIELKNTRQGNTRLRSVDRNETKRVFEFFSTFSHRKKKNKNTENTEKPLKNSPRNTPKPHRTRV